MYVRSAGLLSPATCPGTLLGGCAPHWTAVAANIAMFRVTRSTLSRWNARHRRVVTARVAHSSIDGNLVDASEASESEPIVDESIALESVDIVPLPSPLENEVRGASAVSLDLFASLEDAEEEVSTGGFSLDKTQSFWLLNVVSFLYGTNTTCALLPGARTFAILSSLLRHAAVCSDSFTSPNVQIENVSVSGLSGVRLLGLGGGSWTSLGWSSSDQANLLFTWRQRICLLQTARTRESHVYAIHLPMLWLFTPCVPCTRPTSTRWIVPLSVDWLMGSLPLRGLPCIIS